MEYQRCDEYRGVIGVQGCTWDREMRCVRCSGRKGMSDLDPSCLPPLQITLECTLRPGLVYNKVNPIFHHWSLGDCKFGLTFQSPAEADEFQKSLLAALAALGRGEWCRWWGLEPGLVWVGGGRSLAPSTHCSAGNGRGARSTRRCLGLAKSRTELLNPGMLQAPHPAYPSRPLPSLSSVYKQLHHGSSCSSLKPRSLSDFPSRHHPSPPAGQAVRGRVLW